MSLRWSALALALLLALAGLLPGPASSTVGSSPEPEGPPLGTPEESGRDHSSWWRGWQGDGDANGLDDRLDRALEGPYDSQATVPIFLIYDHMPTDGEVAAVQVLAQVDYRARYIELLTLYQAPLKLVPRLLELPGVVQIQQQNQMVPFLDVSVRALKARPSSEYRDETVWDTLDVKGRGVNVAVLDTGVDDEHEALQNKFVAGYDATDDNPFKDDTGQANPDDRDGHGTHVASTVMGNPPDGNYMGVAPEAELIDVKVMTDAGATNSGNTIEGIEWCIDHKDDDWGDSDPDNDGIDVLSMSFGSVTGDDDGKAADAETVNRAVEAGLIAVVAVGNNGAHQIPSPASADLAITVAAADDQDSISREDDSRADYSNYGPRKDDGDDNLLDELKPEITTYGTGIMAAQASAFGPATNGYTSKDGTSMATPHISGVAALMLEAASDLTPKKLEKALLFAAEGRGDLYDENLSARYNEKWGWGLTDAYRAVQAALGGIVEVEVTSPAPDSVVSGTVTVRGTASAGGGLERVEVEVGGATYQAEGGENWFWNWDTTQLSNATYSLKVTAYSSNNLSAQTTLPYRVDNPPSHQKEKEGWAAKMGALLDQLGESLTGDPDKGPLVAGGGVALLAVGAVLIRVIRSWRGSKEEEW